MMTSRQEIHRMQLMLQHADKLSPASRAFIIDKLIQHDAVVQTANYLIMRRPNVTRTPNHEG